MTDKIIKSISFDPKDIDYLKVIAKKYGLSGDSATIRFIINAHKEWEKVHVN